MIKAGIIGSAGYTAGELIRILLQHPEVEIDFCFSTSQARKAVYAVHQDLVGQTDLRFSDKVNLAVDVVFLCLGHGNSSKFLAENQFASHTKIIDLSNDFRLGQGAAFQGRTFIYGLPELNGSQIREAHNIANPGCFATAIQLAVLPLAKAGLLQDELHIHALTGSTGAGQSLSETTHFTWRNNNVSIYKAFKHQHLGEIGESIGQLQANFSQPINFLPIRGNFARGIFASVYMNTSASETELKSLYQDFYAQSPFTHLFEGEIHLKQVVNTNNCLLSVQKIDSKILITSVIDNLLKGASGQAVQNMNLIFGFEETLGLKLKAGYF